MLKRFLNVEDHPPTTTTDTHSFFTGLFAFGCTGSLLLHGLSSSCSEWVALLHCLLVAEHRLQGPRASVAAAPGPWRASSIVVTLQLSCSAAHGIFPTQGSNPRPLRRQAAPFPLSHQGSPSQCFLSSLSVPSTEPCGSGLGNVKGKTSESSGDPRS